MMHGMGGGRGNLYNGWNGMEDLTTVWSPPPKKWGGEVTTCLVERLGGVESVLSKRWIERGD